MLDDRRRRTLDAQLQAGPFACPTPDQFAGLGAPRQFLADDLAPTPLERVGALTEAAVQRLDGLQERPAGYGG